MTKELTRNRDSLPGIAVLRPEPLSCCGVINPTMRVWERPGPDNIPDGFPA